MNHREVSRRGTGYLSEQKHTDLISISFQSKHLIVFEILFYLFLFFQVSRLKSPCSVLMFQSAQINYDFSIYLPQTFFCFLWFHVQRSCIGLCAWRKLYFCLYIL